MLPEDVMDKLSTPAQGMEVKWKVQANPRSEGKRALVVPFVDARDVAERLDRATKGDWSDLYQVLTEDGLTVECKLTVCGVTRCDAGTGDAIKDAYSDALKRAAVKFGIGRFLYRMPKVYASVNAFGKTYVITTEAEQELQVLTRCFLNGEQYPRFQHINILGAMKTSGPTGTHQNGKASGGKKPARKKPDPPARFLPDDLRARLRSSHLNKDATPATTPMLNIISSALRTVFQQFDLQEGNMTSVDAAEAVLQWLWGVPLGKMTQGQAITTKVWLVGEEPNPTTLEWEVGEASWAEAQLVLAASMAQQHERAA